MIQTLSDALAERGYDKLTPVQEAVIDTEVRDADLLVSAQTGSGKTVAFGLAIGPTLLESEAAFGPAAAPMALIIAPTRELAFQVTRELDWLYSKANARVVSCVGGMDMRDERRALERGAHIVVGTPGRLRDHIQRGSLDMGSLRAIVLDEADEMLDLGFREDLEFMLDEAPEDRRTLMFSATVPPMIAKLAQKFQRDAVRVTTISEKSQHADISYQALRVAPRDSENAIINVLRYHDAQNAIVFANTRATVNRLTARFANRGFAVVCLSGELSQTERTHALQAMRDGRARVCVATDVAARGIDLPNLELVVHAELPSNVEGLLHRSGRTGRAGRKGISALVVPPKMTGRANRLLKTGKITAEWTTAPSAEDILRRDEERLLADPTWTETITDGEAEFAGKLLDLHSPEVIAAAYLRLYRSRQSAPEELSSPDARTPEKERQPFGPSVWFALSVGRDDRAEPRWLLPLLCRAGNIDKDAIGAIRVQQSETFVELSEASVAGFMASLDGETLEKGVKVRRIDGKPEFARSTDSRPPRDKERPRRDKDRPARDFKERAPRDNDRPRPSAPRPQEGEAKPARPPRVKAEGGYGDKPAPRARPAERRDDSGQNARKSAPYKGGDRKEKAEKPDLGRAHTKYSAPAGKRPAAKPETKGAPAEWDSAKKRKSKSSDRPPASDTSKRFKPPRGAAKAGAGGKPAGKHAGKPSGKPFAKPAGKPGGKSFSKSKPGGMQAPTRPKR